MFRKKNQKTTKSNGRLAAIQRADRAFSLYIRTRDSQPYKGSAFRCISCGHVLPIGQADCGHYVNRQHMSLRYSEQNCHAQCRQCNRFDEGNMQGYRKGLVEKMGEQRVGLLEAMKYQENKLSAFELDAIAKEYKKRVKEFEYQIK